jgi:hypothetical protein
VLGDGFGELADMLVELARHVKKRTVILAIKKIRIRTVRNSNANNRGYEKILHIRLPSEPNECHRNRLSINHPTGAIGTLDPTASGFQNILLMCRRELC